MYSRVYVEVTNICNMHCSFCHGHSRPLRRMTVEEFSSILSSLEGVTQYVYYHLMGEPLTHPALPAFLALARERGFRSVITTNGPLLPERGEDIIKAGLHKVFVSLHSFEEGSEDAFLRYLDGAVAFAERAVEAGVIVVFRLWNRGHDDGRNREILSYLRRRLEGEWRENARGIRIREKLYLEWGDRFAWPDRNAPDTGEQVFCYGLGDHFGILVDGTVVPCCLDSEGAIPLGNIHEAPIDEILSSERAEAIRKGFARRRAAEELCRRCGYARRFK